ncbi:crossover junction endonuclease EME1B-like isoform X5 [Glycine soja]|uniref:crossover junction endonuclease EME1B-like isoform X5 n=1 Tax=Glycine soja TaxID=3848 RepID=UPI0007191A14|nr:crossover junction endonuclease EME1B-like isoform X5 [Glycine soja]|eukprot:XP_014631264.1 crossover junction endonuclease EME1B-like isoform X5 [Glycine max]
MDPIILSDEEDPSTPFPLRPKKRRTEPDPNPNPNRTVFVIDDDPTPHKSATPSIVPETPMSALFDSDIAIVKCTIPSDPTARVSPKKFSAPSGISQMICLESDNESENCGMGTRDKNEPRDSRWISNSMGSGSSPERHISWGNATQTEMPGDDLSNPASSQVENMNMQQEENANNIKKSKVSAKNTTKAVGKTKMTKEERSRLMEEKKLQKEQEKLKKAALKAEAAELKKIEKEKQKWEKGKFAMKSIVAEIDAKVVELGSIGGHLLTRFAEKGLTYHITSNPITGSILWSMKVPEHISQLSTERIEIPYILLVYEADKFCNLVMNDSLFDQLSSIQSLYPAYTVCYLTNRLLAYINKKEQEKYKNPENNSCWRRPPVEEVLAKLTTNFNKVHSRQCADEAELAEHVVGLTCSLASCQFRKKLSRLSVNANGALIPKDYVDRNLIKKSLWLKALVAMPKVQPRFAIAIGKKYPTMKSLLSVYMDPSKSEHEKEFLLQDLMTEGLLGGDRRLGEVCSKRVYRILMAQSGCIRTDDVENGADFFERQS